MTDKSTPTLETPRLRVLYDISGLGIGHYRARGKTGIYRVAENVGRGLAESEDVALSLTATLSLQIYKEAGDYLRETDSFPGYQLIPPFAPTRRMHMALATGELADSLSLPPRIRRVSRFASWRAVQVLASPGIDPRIWSGGSHDILHSPFLPFPDGSHGSGVTRVLTVYDMLPVIMPQHFPDQIRRVFGRIVRSIRSDDWILCISEVTKRDFCRLTGFAPERVTVTHLGFDRQAFFHETDSARHQAVRRRYGIPDGPYILCVNTREPRKNTKSLVEAFASLGSSGRLAGVSLVLAGTPGWHQDEMDLAVAKARRSAPGNPIIETGFVADADLAALYSGAEMFVFVPLYEGFGLPALEAMACGVPVIASNTSSLPEVVGDAAITLDPLDVAGLEDALKCLHENPEARADYAARSLARSTHFSWDRCVAETISAYRQALSTVPGSCGDVES